MSHIAIIPAPHPRSDTSIEALACWRGANVGCAMAEAFRVARQIITDYNR